VKIKLPATRKGRVWASVGAFVGLVSIVGTISDANRDPQDKRYEVCMQAYHDPKVCYEDVYGDRGPQGPSVDTPAPAPTDIPVPPTTPVDPPTTPPNWDPFPVRHFHFNPDVRLDASEVEDLR
jgi:hypothetical protein